VGRTDDVFVSTEPPRRELVRLSGLIVACFFAVEIVGVLLLIALPIREVLPKDSRALPELMRLPELAAGCFAAVGADGPLVLIKLPMREFEFARGELELAAGCFFTVEIDGVLLRIELPIREVLPELVPLPERAAGCFATVGADGFLVPIELPVRELEVVRDGLRLAAGCFLAAEIDGVLLLIKLPIRKALLELGLLLDRLEVRLRFPTGRELVVGCFAVVEADGLLVLIEPPMREVDVVRDEPDLVVGCLPEVEMDGVLLLVKLPIREVLLEFMRLLARLEVRLRPPAGLELAAGCFAAAEADGLFVLIELPMRELDVVRDEPDLVVGCLFTTDTDGALLLIELPIRDVLLELIRALELFVVRLPMLDLTPVDLPVAEDLDEGRGMLGEVLDCAVLRLDVIVPERPVVGALLVNALLELLRLDVIVLERLVVGTRLVVTRLGPRLEVTVRDREVVGVLLVNVLLELLRLVVLGLVGVRTERELTLLLRLLPALADARDLDVDAGLEACVFWLLLRDDPLFFEFFAAKTGSVASVRIKMQNAKIKEIIPARRNSAILIFDV
jgi:hypothetical protein